MTTDDSDLSTLLALLLGSQTPSQATALVVAVAVTASASLRTTRGLLPEVRNLHAQLEAQSLELTEVRQQLNATLSAQRQALAQIQQALELRQMP